MNVLKQSREDLSKKELYKITHSDSSAKMKDFNGTTLEVKDWVLYEEEDSNGELKTVLSLATPEGLIISTISPTFQKKFTEITDIFWGDEEVLEIIVKTAQTKNGREYVTCDIV